MAQWVIERWRGNAASLHQRPMPVDARRRVSVLEVTRPAIVLGSRSPDLSTSVHGDVDLTTRRSGGGAVWVEPGNSTWLDVFVPAGDALAEADIGLAFLWLGEALERAVASLGVAGHLHRGAHRPGPDHGLVCFEGVGAGEVLIGDRKLIGISQRRTRAGSRFQCVWYRHWTLGALADAVGPLIAERAARAGVGLDALVAPRDAGRLLERAVWEIRQR